MKPREKWALWALITAGTVLWLINWWAGRPLFIDEANVARNLYDRSFAELFSPLDYRQYAPPLYLALAKASGELFGYGERALRAPALLGGLLAIVGLYRAGRALQLGWWLLLPLALLFVNPEVLRYTGEVKPYAIDLGVAAMLLALALERPAKSTRFWMLTGVTVCWLSLPSVFVLGGIALTNFLCTGVRAQKSRHKERMHWVITGFCWLLSFGLLYLLVLRPSIGSSYLNNYHDAWFFPLPQPDYPWQQLGQILFALIKLTFGFTLLAVLLGSAIFLTGWLRSDREHWLLFTLPLLLVILAAGFGYYSLLPRLILFTLPGSWLLATLGSKYLFGRITKTGYWRYTLVAGIVLMLGGTNVVRHFWSPLTFSDSRRLVTELQAGYTPIMHHSAVPGFDYYRRILPEHKQDTIPAAESNIREQALPGKYVLLYDVLTQGNIRESMRSDSIWAAERGCRVRTTAMFRAKAVYVTCE